MIKANEKEQHSHYPTYQNTGTLFMVINGGYMKRCPAVLTSLLNVYALSMLTHHFEGGHLVQLCGQVNGGLLFVIQYGCVDFPAADN